MKLHVAYDQHGKILAATEAKSGEDRIVAPPGATLAELDVPTKFEKGNFTDFIHLLQVDIRQKRLVERS
jgi:hypothetical protein